MNIQFNVNDEFLRNVLCGAIEGGGNCWAAFKQCEMHKQHYDAATVLEMGDEDEPQSEKRIGIAEMRKGVEIMLARTFTDPDAQCHVKYSAKVYEAIIADDAGCVDANLADLILQCAYFGHIAYD